METGIDAVVGLIIAIAGGVLIGLAFIYFAKRDPQQLAAIIVKAGGA